MPKTRQPSQNLRTPMGSTNRVNVASETESERSEEKRTGPSVMSGQWRGVYTFIPPLLALIASMNSLWNYFAADDLEQVLNNPFIKRLGNLPSAFTSSVWSFTAADIVFTVDPYFRPIFSSLFTLNYALFGTTAWGWHLVNVLVHAGVTILVFVVAREATHRSWVAGVTATLFAVHPVHAEPVAWVSGVTDPLMALLLLPAFYFYLRSRRRAAWHLFACALGFFFLALLSKETALALPLMLAYCELFYFETETPLRQRLVRASRLLALFAIPTAIYFLMRYHALGVLVFSGQPRYPLVPSLLSVPLEIVKYLALTVVPGGYSYVHHFDFVESLGSPLFLAPLALVIGIVIGLALLKSRALTLAAIWFIVMLAPALVALRQFEPAYLLQERYLYAPSIGICLAIALGVERIAVSERFGSRRRIIAAGLTVALALIWGAVFIRQNRVWDDTVTVYKNSVAEAPRSPIARVLLSRSYYDAGRPREAEAEARTALDLDSRCPTAYLNLSYFARMSGKLDKACEYLEQGISAVPEGTMTRHDLATIYLNLGLLYGQRKMFERGEEDLLRSNEISPRPVAWYHTGQFYFDQGRLEEARAMFERTLEHVPRWFAPIHLRLGLTYEAMKDTPRAEMEYEKYLELAPPEAPDRDGVRKHLVDMKGGPPSK